MPPFETAKTNFAERDRIIVLGRACEAVSRERERTCEHE
jgi:hypothetical protein